MATYCVIHTAAKCPQMVGVTHTRGSNETSSVRRCVQCGGRGLGAGKRAQWREEGKLRQQISQTPLGRIPRPVGGKHCDAWRGWTTLEFHNDARQQQPGSVANGNEVCLDQWTMSLSWDDKWAWKRPDLYILFVSYKRLNGNCCS